MKSLKIQNLKLKNPLFLAPMVDVTDLPFRILCRQQGVAIAYTEMIYIDAILHENKKTLDLLKTSKKDKPLGLQITGNNPKEFLKFSKLNIQNKFDLIDLNCGCPSTRIVGNQAGSYLLKSPDKIRKIIKILKDTNQIVTAKIRLGYKNNNVIKVSKAIEKGGADLLTIHARTAQQKSSESSNWKWIKKVKEQIGIPVIGNGGVKDGKTASEMLDMVDGVMIASAAIGNPNIFKEILYYLETGKEIQTSSEKRINLFLEYLNLARKYDLVDLKRIKFLGSHFLKGFNRASKLRQNLMTLKNYEQIEKFIKNINI